MLWRLANQSLLSDLMVELHRESYCDPGLSTLVRVTACRFVIDLLDRSVRMIAALGVFIPAPAAKPKSLFSLEPKPEQAEASAEQEPLPQEESQQLEEALLSEEALQLVALVARIDVKLPRSPFKELALKREIALSHESARSALEGSATGGVDSTPEPEIEENVKQDFKEGIHEILDEAYDEVRDDVLDDVLDDVRDEALDEARDEAHDEAHDDFDDDFDDEAAATSVPKRELSAGRSALQTSSVSSGIKMESQNGAGLLRVLVVAPKVQPSVSKLRFFGTALILARNMDELSEEVPINTLNCKLLLIPIRTPLT